MSSRPAPRALCPALALAVLLVGLMPADAAAATVTVHLNDSLNPKTLTIAVGTSVRWVNESDDRHRMRSRNGPVEFDSHNLEPGDAYSFTFTRAGTYGYVDERDRDDSNFHGTIIVRAASPPAGSATPAPDGSAPAGGGGGGGAAPSSATVHMAGRTFGPSSVTIAAGGSVTFLNDDDREHTATGDSFDTGVLNPGAQSRETFPSAGTFSFLCAIHPEMRGTVNVRGSSGAAPTAPAATPPPTPTPQPVFPDQPGSGDQVASIIDFAFAPGEVQVAAGSTVTWQNDGEAPHTVTAGDGSFDSGFLAAGGRWSRRFDAPGTYAFACQFHPEMTGTLVVGAATGTSGGPPQSASPATSASPGTSPSASPTAASAPDFAGSGGDSAGPPAAAGPDSSAAAALRDGALRLLVVAGLTAGGVIGFGMLIAGTTRRGKPHETRRTR
jgi:plastocyanin